MKVSVAFFPSSMLMAGMHSLILQFSSTAARQKCRRRTGDRLRNEVMDYAMVKIFTRPFPLAHLPHPSAGK